MTRHFSGLACATLAAIMLAPLLPLQAQQKELPLSPLPLMGWSSWNHYGKRVTEADVRANADAMVSSGLRDLGYVYVNLDGSWEGERDANGVLGVNPKKFNDMKALGDYIHSRGLKFGVYSSPGPKTCGGFEASYGHEDQDAQMFASWGADYLKYDLCTFHEKMLDVDKEQGHEAAVKLEIAAYEKMHQALIKTNRPILYALCQYGTDYVWKWAPDVGATMYRTTIDIANNWNSLVAVGFSQAGLAKYAGKGHYLDPDSLEIGNGALTLNESRLQMSMWSILAAPLILGNDVSHMDKDALDTLSNKEVIAIDQDPLVKPGDRVWVEGSQEIWTRPMTQGKLAVALFNRGHGDILMPLDLKQAGWTGAAKARDVWEHKDLTLKDQMMFRVPKHGVVLLVLSH